MAAADWAGLSHEFIFGIDVIAKGAVVVGANADGTMAYTGVSFGLGVKAIPATAIYHEPVNVTMGSITINGVEDRGWVNVSATKDGIIVRIGGRTFKIKSNGQITEIDSDSQEDDDQMSPSEDDED